MKRITYLTVAFVVLLALTLGAAPKPNAIGKDQRTTALSIDNETYINANNILMFVTNHGNFARDLSGVFGYDYGTFYPYNTVADIQSGVSNNSIIYASGLWIGAIDSATGEKRVAIAEYNDEYVPGPMKDGTFQPDTSAFRVYKLYSDSLADNPNIDYLEWPIDEGAPYKVVGNDTVPDMMGTQMLWAVFNDADPDQHSNGAGTTAPLGIEVRQTTFAYDRTDPLGDVIFMRLGIYNKGDNTLKDCYFSLWSDADLGQFTDDLVGCDTILSIGYCYNGDNNDNQFGSSPPCVGYDFFQGPLIYTGNLDDTARMWGQKWPEYVNMGMTSFDKYINGTDPDDFGQTYNYMRGLRRDGSPYVYNGVPTTFFVAGDPVTGVGDIDVTPADRRFMMSTGPITFRPGDSTEILAAIVVGQGADRLSSVAIMRYNDQFAQAAYENDFVLVEPPAKPGVEANVNDNRVTLTWDNNAELNPGTYDFEGYTIWQGESSSGPWKRIANYDITNQIVDIYDLVPDPVTGALETRLVKKGSDAGLQYNLVLKNDMINGGLLDNLRSYFYKVDAYSYNPNVAVAKTQTSDSQVVAIPQSPVADIEFLDNFGDTVRVNHIGGSDGIVLPYAVNSKLFDGNTYRVTFTDTIGFRIDTVVEWFPPNPPETTFVSYDVVWHLVNISADPPDTLLGWQWDQSGDSTYKFLDGVWLTISGPPLELNSIEWEGTPVLDGVDWGGSSYNGGIGILGEWWGSTLTPADLKTVEIRWVEDGTGQAAYCWRRDEGYAFDGFHPNQNFEVWDVTSNPPRQINFGFVEYYDPTDNSGQSADSLWNPGEQVDLNGDPDPGGGREYFTIHNSTYTGVADPTYEIDYGFADSDVLYGGWLAATEGTSGKPKPGTIFRLTPNFINTPSDTFTFTLQDTIFMAKNEVALDRINTVPNPFYLYSAYDPAPGNYQLKFQHLPETCTIRIFNLAGDLVRRLEKDDPDASYMNWDLKTENGLLVASGIYLYVVEAPGYGTKFGKMAIFTEVEVLDIY